MTKKVDNVKALGEVVVQPIGIDQKELYEKIKKFDSNHQKLKDIEDLVSESKEELKNIGIAEFKRIYDTEYKNPATIIIQAQDNDNIANYKLISKATYNYKGDFTDLPSELYVETESVKIDAKLIDKYYHVFQKFIKQSKDISVEDKESILLKKKDKSLVKDAITNLGKFKDTEIKYLPSVLLEKVSPQFAVSDQKVISL